MSASVISRAQNSSKKCSAARRPRAGRISGWACSSVCHQRVPEPTVPTPTKSGGPAARSGADDIGRGRGGEVGEVSPEREVDLRLGGGEANDLGLERRLQA